MHTCYQSTGKSILEIRGVLGISCVFLLSTFLQRYFVLQLFLFRYVNELA